MNSIQTFVGIGRSGGLSVLWRWNMLTQPEVPANCFVSSGLSVGKHRAWAKLSATQPADRSTFKQTLENSRQQRVPQLFWQASMACYISSTGRIGDSLGNLSFRTSQSTKLWLASPALSKNRGTGLVRELSICFRRSNTLKSSSVNGRVDRYPHL